MKNKLAVRNWHKIIRETRFEAEQKLTVAVFGQGAQVQGLMSLLGPGAGAVFKTGEKPDSLGASDLVVLVAAGNASIDEGLRRAAEEAIGLGLEIMALIDDAGLSDSARQAKKVEAEIALNLSPGRIDFFSMEMSVDEKKTLLKKIADRIGVKAVALAARVTNFRPLLVSRIINDIAGQNAVIGAAGFIPASDLPVLTANQIRMVLKIAAAYGATVSLKRTKELLVVVGGGFTFRAIARQLVGLVPIAGWAVKGAVAYTGTRALGDLAVKYFAGLEEPD